MMASLSDAAVFLSTPSARRATRRPASAGRPAEISIHALREEGDFAGVAPFGDCFLFLSTPSARRATSDRLSAHGFLLFLSTPSARRATVQRRVDSSAGGNFYPRPPRGGRPGPRRSRPGKSSNFYPRPPRGGRLRDAVRGLSGQMISIHALREEGDRAVCDKLTQLADISIHALREEGDGMGTVGLATPLPFLSTPSARRATGTPAPTVALWSNFYPRPPRGGRHVAVKNTAQVVDISIHALREEGDDSLLMG